MAERTETIGTRDGKMDVFVAHPDNPAPSSPVLVQVMDALGMREELRDHARRAAAWGYYVLAPDLFYRAGLKGPLDFTRDDEREKIMAAMGVLTAERATSDIVAALDLAAADPAAGDGKIGLYGFCMGGKLVVELCQSLGDRVAAGASIHPGGLATDAPESPHRHLDRVSAEIYFGIADKDATATPEQIADLERELRAHAIEYTLEWHPGALHGYMMPGRADVYNEQAAETVWRRMEALFARTLQ